MLAEIIPAKMLEIELNSPEFIAGLEKCIGLTQKTGFETLFAVNKGISSSKVRYGNRILIGDEGKVGYDLETKRMIEFEKRFEKEYGKDNSEKYEEFFLSLPEHERPYSDFPGLTPQEKLDEIKLLIEDIKEQEIKMFRNKSFSSTKKSRLLREFQRKRSDLTNMKVNPKVGLHPEVLPDENHGHYYELFSSHTHPSGKITPSSFDLKYINSLRRFYQEQDLGFVPSPIMVIAGINQTNCIPISLIKERSNLPLTQERLEAANKGADIVTHEQSRAMGVSMSFPEEVDDFISSYASAIGYFYREERVIDIENLTQFETTFSQTNTY